MRCWQLKALLPTVFALVVVLSACPTTADQGARPQRQAEKGTFVLDRMDIFTPGDISLLEGLGLLLGLSTGDVSSILNLVKVGLGVADFVGEIFNRVFNGSTFDINFDTTSRQDMLAMYEVLSARLDQMHLGVQGIESSLRSMSRGLPAMLRWEVMLDSLEDYTRPINSLHHQFTFYQKHRENIEEHTLRDFANSVVHHGTTSIRILMANVHSMVAPDAPPLPMSLHRSQVMTTLGPEYLTVNSVVNQNYQNHLNQLMRENENDKDRTGRRLVKREAELAELSLRPSIFIVLERVLQAYDQCELYQSHQQMLMGLYSLLAITQARGYAMMTYSYMLLRSYGEGNFTVEQELARDLYDHYSRNTMLTALDVLGRASSSYSRCDPEKHVQGDTYIMFTELLQGHIENEANLNSRGSCTSSCATYEHSRVHGCYLPDTQICGSRKKCQGTVHDCKFINADADVCFSSNPYRRYDWLHYESGAVLGDRGTCDDVQKVDSWWRWFVHCSYCVCLCDDPSSPTSDRYVSLLPSVTDIEDGMVLTGVKLSKHKRVVTMEIQQGRAMPQGQVDPSSLSWVTIPDLDIERSSFQSGRDYHILSYEARSLDLDKLVAPNDHVITGTRFRMLGAHLNLEIRVTPVNFTVGGLQADLSYWISNDNTPVMAQTPRQEVVLYTPGDPSKQALDSERDSKPDMFVQFQATDLYADVAQLTVPFLDAQPVTTSPPSWMSGLHLFHKGLKGSGGFVALELECYNTTRHFQDAMVTSQQPDPAVQ